MACRLLTPGVATVALTAVLALPGDARADDTPSQVWMAINADQSGGGSAAWGRLSVRNGMLTFHGTQADWKTPLAKIRRITPIKGSHVFAIETMSGDVLRLAILNQQLLAVSPKKTMQVLQRAVREAPPAQPPVVSASAAPKRTVR
jgi:hypothetical protein